MGALSSCKKCGGSGWLFNLELSQAVRCGCHHPQASSILGASGIPDRFSKSKLSSLKPATEIEKESLAKLRKLFSFKKGIKFKTILIAGPPGVGKTHILCSALGAAATSGVRIHYWDFPNLCREIRDRFTKGPTDIVGKACKVSLLSLDNVGFGRASEFERSVINEIACSRYDLGLPTIYATNYRPHSSAPPSGLGSRVSEHVYSRLTSEHIFILNGHDRRQAEQ